MNPLLDDRNRQVVPRWRSSRITTSLGELASHDAAPDRPLAQPDLIATKVAEWKEQKTLSFATDLLASAIVAGDVTNAREAATFVLSPEANASEAARIVAARVLSPLRFDGAEGEFSSHSDERALRRAVRIARGRVRQDPRNAVAWGDMSLAYASLGFRDKAVHAMEVALVLAPSNRYIVRSAARLFLHTRDLDRALVVVRSAPTLKSDPWLIAAEIAVAGAIEARTKLVKFGSRVLAESGASPFHLTELASAIATVDLHSGDVRSAKKLFKLALEDPTDNSVAQAAWVSRGANIITLTAAHLDKPRSFEARAREALRDGRWEDALMAALQWMDDESFSAAPVLLASYIASVILDDVAEAMRILAIGRIANPHHWELTNNTAFCYATGGDPEGAAREFEVLDPSPENTQRHGTWLATRGLIEFRRGSAESGRAFYKAAIEEFSTPGFKNARALAAIFLAREEVVAGTTASAVAIQEARDYLNKADAPELLFLLTRVEAKAAAVASP